MRGSGCRLVEDDDGGRHELKRAVAVVRVSSIVFVGNGVVMSMYIVVTVSFDNSYQ